MNKRSRAERKEISLESLGDLEININGYESFGHAMMDNEKRKEITDKLSDIAKSKVIDEIIKEANDSFNEVIDIADKICKEETIENKEIFIEEIDNLLKAIVELSGALDKEVKFGCPMIFEAKMVYKVGVDEIIKQLMARVTAIGLTSLVMDSYTSRKVGVKSLKEDAFPLLKLLSEVIKKSTDELEVSKKKTHEELRKEHGKNGRIDMSKTLEVDLDKFKL
ncbi:hypothetical protein UT300003_32430 [Clostridium sardiniense]